MDDNLCPICYEIPDLPVSINISKTKKCPFINKNLVCLRCISKMISINSMYSYKIKCLCNSHYIDVSNLHFRCYGDVYHTSDNFVESKLWNSLYNKNKKCNNCNKKFKNIKELYKHYQYYGDYCFPINKKKIILLIFIFIVHFLNQFLIYYYFNYCTIFIFDTNKRYCFENLCNNFICENLIKNYIPFNINILVIYYSTISIFIENIINFNKNYKIIWKNEYQLYNIFILIYLLIVLYLEIDNINDLQLFSLTKSIIELSIQIKILCKFSHHIYK